MTEAGFTTMRLCAVRVLLGAMLALAGSNASAQTPVAVTVYFGDSAYAVNEGGSVEVQVQLSADPERDLTIPWKRHPAPGPGPATSRWYRPK